MTAQNPAKTQNTPVVVMRSTRVRKNWATSHAANQLAAVATATALPRTWEGKISLMIVQTIGPSEKAKQAMKTTSATRVIEALAGGRPGGGARPGSPSTA